MIENQQHDDDDAQNELHKELEGISKQFSCVFT
jgi:hypothetical protein